MGEEETALDFLAEKGDEAERTKNRERLGALLFTREEMAFPLARLSGGEKAKLLLLSFIVKKANVLLLDEPTRNLSPNSAPRIHSLLRSFAGTLIAVSHDRVFLAACFERFYELTPEGLSPKENL
jgi:ATPase subunit of ABC transporter with duplicated ATPase domains